MTTIDTTRADDLRSRLAADALAGKTPSAKDLEQLEHAETAASIIEQAEVLRQQRAREASEHALAEQQAAAKAKIVAAAEKYFAAIAQAEKSARDLVTNIGAVTDEARELRMLYQAAGLHPPPALNSFPLEKRLSERVSAVFGPLAGQSGRYGNVEFHKAPYSKPADSWTDGPRGERRELEASLQFTTDK